MTDHDCDIPDDPLEVHYLWSTDETWRCPECGSCWTIVDVAHDASVFLGLRMTGSRLPWRLRHGLEKLRETLARPKSRPS